MGLSRVLGEAERRRGAADLAHAPAEGEPFRAPARRARPPPGQKTLVAPAFVPIFGGNLCRMSKSKKEFASRFSASLPPALLRQLDAMVREKGYANRSQAIADMIRAQLVEHRQQTGDGEIAGSVTLVYDHHQHRLQEHLTDLQHDHGELILATLHCHLDHHHCLELIAVRGPQAAVKKLADGLIGARGVKHGKLVVTSPGHDLPA